MSTPAVKLLKSYYIKKTHFNFNSRSFKKFYVEAYVGHYFPVIAQLTSLSLFYKANI